MFWHGDSKVEVPADLERYLEQGARADPNELSDLISWLDKVDPEGNSEAAVKVVQLLGTAAGKQWGEHRTNCTRW